MSHNPFYLPFFISFDPPSRPAPTPSPDSKPAEDVRQVRQQAQVRSSKNFEFSPKLPNPFPQSPFFLLQIHTTESQTSGSGIKISDRASLRERDSESETVRGECDNVDGNHGMGFTGSGVGNLEL
ncbi:Hypothetical predicted protein [Olea europaea subsp. europaea]|uniref:Uncharacterized protein n=1 Tax=Olea europaea subsp. europaea TaxID=158383 RepID=A0A8S0ULM8_OLEEU|nr:Hypothetical predicted protein [Olea europaea subsp. europaea]